MGAQGGTGKDGGWWWREPLGSAFGESGPGKAPQDLSSDKTGSYRNKYERPWNRKSPGNYSKELESALASLCVLGHFAYPLWASVSSL